MKEVPTIGRDVAKNMFQVHGVDGSSETVTSAVNVSHAPGHAEVDFGEALGEIGRVVRKLHCFAMALPHSDAFFVKAYPAGGRHSQRRPEMEHGRRGVPPAA